MLVEQACRWRRPLRVGVEGACRLQRARGIWGFRQGSRFVGLGRVRIEAASLRLSLSLSLSLSVALSLSLSLYISVGL